jgi:TP901 family phage tail tape measure protein
VAEVANGIINIEINTGDASAALKQLQQQINAFNVALSKQNKNQAIFAQDYANQLKLAVDKTGLFTAETIKLSTAAATLDKNLSKGKVSLGQFFSAKFNKDSAVAAEVMGLAAERAKAMQTQFIATAGASKGMQDALAIRPLAAFSSETAIASQRAEILSSMFKQGTTQLINFGKNVQWAGRQLMVGFTVPLTIFGNTAGKTFMELERQAVSFKKVYGDIFTTPAEVEKNLQAVTDLGKEYTKYGIAVKDTIGLAAQAAAAGRKNADLTDAVAQATRLATLGQMDQNAALETTISLQSAFRLSGKDLADTINFLNMVENQTVVSLQDIAAAIPRVAPVIQGLGGDVKDLTVFLAAMQEGGVDAAEGANALKSGLASLINPTKAAKEMLGGFGINLDSIIQANRGDLMGTVMAFSQALQNLDQFQRQQSLEQVFGKFQYAKLGALFDNISRQGSQAQQVIATMGYSTEQLGKTADKELKTIEESFGVQLTAAVERFKLAIAPIGEIFVKTAIPIVNFVTRILENFNQLSDGKKQFIAIATVITGVVIPAGTMLLGLLLNLTGTLAKIIQGFGAFSKGFITGGPIGAIKALTQSSKYFSLAELDAANAAQQLAGASQAVNLAFLEQATAASAATGAVNALTVVYEKLIAAQTAASGFASFTTPGASANIAKGAGKGKGKGIKRNKGGLVPGVGNTDTVPAMLTPGESVITKQATQKYGPLIDAMNSGKLPGFNGGVRDVNFSKMGQALSLFGFGESTRSSQTPSSSRARGGVSQLAIFALRSLRGQQSRSGGIRVRDRRSTRRIAESGVTTPYSGVRGSLTGPGLREYERVWGKDAREELISRTASNSGFIAGHLYGSGFNLRQLGLRGKRGSSPRSSASQLSQQGLYGEAELAKLEKMGQREIDILPNNLVVILEDFNKALERGTGSRANWSPISGRDLLTTSSHLGQLTMPDGSKLPTQLVRAVSRRAASKVNKAMSGADTMVGEDGFARLVAQAEKEAILEIFPRFGYNSGGTVAGSGNKDTVPAMLTPGEFVINKDAARKNKGVLQAINNGDVQAYGIGGIVAKAGAALKNKKVQNVAQAGITTAGMMSGDPLMMAASMIGPYLIGPAKKIGTQMLTKFGPAMLGTTGAFVALGFAAYKLNQQVNKAQDAGSDFTKAMYGTAKSAENMAEFFGNQTFAQQARIAAVEKASGTPISQEAQQAGTGFIQSDAGKQLIKDIGIVRSGGGNPIEALRNQLSAGIISGAIGVEEANAIAVEVGKAIGDQNIAVSVAGELNQLLGPDGKDILKNLSTITTEISPKINATKLASDAQAAYEKLNVGQKFVKLFTGGAEDFKKSYEINQVSTELATGYKNEANALELLNLAYQQGSISLEEFSKKRGEITTAGAGSQDAIAKSLGFQSYNDLVEASKGTKITGTAAGGGNTGRMVGMTSRTEQQQAAYDVIQAQSKNVKTMLEELPGSTDEFVKKTMEGLNKIGGSSFGKLLSGELSIADVSIVATWSGDLTPEELNAATENLQLMRTIPDIESKFNFNSSNAPEQMQDIIDKAKEIEDNPDIVKDFIANDKFTATFKQFGVNYNTFANLDDIEKSLIMKHIDMYTTYRASIVKDRVTDPGEVARDLRQLDATLGTQIKNIAGSGNKAQNVDLNALDGSSGGGGGSGKNKLAEMKKNLMDRFDLVSKRLDLEASKYEKVNRQLERQNELDRRGIEEISKKEDAVNKAYDARLEALDKIEQANDRIKQQEDSRINLAQALASGNIGAAAAAMNEIQAQNTANAIADTRAGLEEAHQNALKNISIEINGQLLTREEIEKRIESRELKMRANQDALYKIETERLANAEKLERVQAKMYLLEEKKAISYLKKNKSKLSKSEKSELASLISEAQSLADAYGFDMKFMYGGQVKKYASGGAVGGSGNTDRVRSLLTPGEFVVRKSVAQQNMPLLESLNNDIYPTLNAPRYSVPSSDFGTVSTGTSVSSTVYNDTYTINVNVAGTSTSADEIANVVMNKLSASNSGTIRSRRYGS